MRLFNHPLSSNGRRVAMAARLLDIKLDVVEVDLGDEAAVRRLKEINPNGMVPVLEDGDLTLSESCAIMQYLTDLSPGQQLYPSEPRARADVSRWMFWACQHFFPAVGVLTYENIWKGMVGLGEADPREVARGERDFHQFATVLDNHLRDRSWVAGQSLSLADLAIAPALMYTGPGKLPVQGYANVLRWFQRIEAMDAWKQTHAQWPEG